MYWTRYPKRKSALNLLIWTRTWQQVGAFMKRPNKTKKKADLRRRRAPRSTPRRASHKENSKENNKKGKTAILFDFFVNILWFSTFHFVRFQVRVVFSIDGEHPPEGRSVDVAAAHAFEGLSFRPLFDALQKGRTALGTLRAPKRKSFRALTGLHYKLLSTN